MPLTSAKVQADFDEVLYACLDVAQLRLDTVGETSHYAVMKPFHGELMAIDASAEEIAAQTTSGTTDADAAAEAAVMKNVLHVAGGYCAVGIVATVVALGSEFVRVDLEHREGVWQTMLLPFTRATGGVAFGELQNTPGERRIWN